MRCIASTAAVLVLAAAVAACGGSSGSSAAAAPPAASVIADQLGATDVQAQDPTLYAYDEVTATLNGKTVDIATFRDDKLRDRWIQAASQFAGIEQKGHLYAVADG